MLENAKANFLIGFGKGKNLYELMQAAGRYSILNSFSSMTDRIFIRVSKETKKKLDECTKELEITRSDVVRKGIDMVHDNLKK